MLTACPSNQIGEVEREDRLAAPDGRAAYDIHFDDAPTFYVNGQPTRTDATVRQLERDVGNATAIDPYAGGVAVPIAVNLADPVEEQTLHMINADPKRTPTFTLFGNPDFFFQTTTPTCGGNVCVNPGFAWNHGDIQQEIGNTWLGMVGPGVAPARRRPTRSGPTTSTSGRRSCRILGLADNYVDDGRVITQILDGRLHGVRRRTPRRSSATSTSS